jgi:hypothetical protein
MGFGRFSAYDSIPDGQFEERRSLLRLNRMQRQERATWAGTLPAVTGYTNYRATR